MVKFAGAETFGHILKARRKTLTLSQAKLAELAQTTPRNISNLETGKISPTRTMVKRLAIALRSNQQSYSELMRVAGYVYESHFSDEIDEYQTQVQLATELLLQRHAPYPALAVNRRYDIIQVNTGFYQALEFLTGHAITDLPLPLSLIEVLFGLHVFNDAFLDQEGCARFLIQRIYQEQLNNPSSNNLIKTLKLKLPHIPDAWWQFDPNYQPSPTLRTDLSVKGKVYETLGVLHSMGSPHDFGGNSVRVILSYPLNDAAIALFDSWAS